jgi:hypothetical protein
MRYRGYGLPIDDLIFDNATAQRRPTVPEEQQNTVLYPPVSLQRRSDTDQDDRTDDRHAQQAAGHRENFGYIRSIKQHWFCPRLSVIGREALPIQRDRPFLVQGQIGVRSGSLTTSMGWPNARAGCNSASISAEEVFARSILPSIVLGGRFEQEQNRPNPFLSQAALSDFIGLEPLPISIFRGFIASGILRTRSICSRPLS